MNEEVEEEAEEEAEKLQPTEINEKIVPVINPTYPIDPLPIDDQIGFNSQLLNAFAGKMFEELSRCDKNHVICPINLFATFGILYFGSEGETFHELQEFLDRRYWRQVFNDGDALKTIQTLLQVFAYERFKLRPNYDLFNIIRLLVDKRVEYSHKYKILVKRYFNVDIDRIDFKSDSDVICDQMNELIKNEFNANIEDFLTKIDNQSQLILLSAIRFKGKWEKIFALDKIRDDYFYTDGDRRTTVKMMELLGQTFLYGLNREWDSQIVEIPFADQSMSFIMIVPTKNDGFNTILDLCQYKSLSKAIEGLNRRICDVILPKFKLDCDYDFSKLYPNLRVFNNNSDLTKIGGNHIIKVNNCLHKVIFEINNSGVNPPEPRMSSVKPVLIKANHPFLFIVKDNRTGVWVFIGKVEKL